MPESKARRRVIARFYWEEPQHSYRVREACIAAENSRVTGIHQSFGTTDDDSNAMTHEDALQSLARLTYLIYEVKGTRHARIIQPDDAQRALLDALGIHFPRQTAKAL